MFDSGISAFDLIEEIKEEADIAIPISDNTYATWLNALEQLLYSEIIKEQEKSDIDLTRSLADLAAAHPDLKLNLWPLFDCQRTGDAVLDVSEDGTYTLHVESASGAISEGAVFTKKITLRKGTYTLSDNAQAYGGTVPSALNRIYITDASTGGVLVGLSFQASQNTGESFTVDKDTEVVLNIRVLEDYNYGAEGSAFWPQLELGSIKTPAVIPPVSVVLGSEVPVIVCDLPVGIAEAPVRFEDIHAVYADDTQMIKSTLATGPLLPDTYFKDANKLGLHLSRVPGNLTIVYYARPKLKDPDELRRHNVMLPVEFIDLARAKLRGEAYKLANEAGLAAMWLNDYNVLLETFKAWLAAKQPSFGM